MKKAGSKTNVGTAGKRISNGIKSWDGKKQGPSSKNKGFGSK
jgi:hypothetical protein